MRSIAVGFAVFVVCGCASSSDESAGGGVTDENTGGATPSPKADAATPLDARGAAGVQAGGSTAAGGRANVGGAAGTGGSTGGAPGTGGSAGTGGAPGTGGSAGTGGAPGTGGAGGTASGQPGVWQNVTPTGLNLDPNYPYSAANFGVQDVLVDPVRPTDFYAFTCYNGVWKSTDYGLGWSKVSTGTNASILDQGRMWTAAIDSNKSRSPSTPPTLYTVDGYGSQPGLYKSTDGGVNFAYIDPSGAGLGKDVYALDVDPYDSQHMLMGFHGAGLAESVDAGATWTNRTGSAAGSSIYPFFVDTGNAATTRKTWVTVPQWWNNSEGMWLTTSGGAAWSRVSDVEHLHGGAQVFNAGAGVVYAAGMSVSPGSGVFRSTDAGATWAKAYGDKENGVFGTKSHLYASYGWATGSAQYNDGAPRLSSAASDGSGWAPMTAPAAMWNGAKRAATSFDGSHSVIVSGNWGAGLWRYIEP